MADAQKVRLTALLPQQSPIAAVLESELCDEPEPSGRPRRWDRIGQLAWQRILEELDCDLLDQLAQAWRKAEALRKYADPDAYPQETKVHLSEHAFVHDVHPVLEVRLPYCRPRQLRFTLSLSAHFGGLALWIRRGHIIACSAGDAWVGAALKYGDLDLCPELASRQLPLSQRRQLGGAGIRIPSLTPG